MITNGKRALAHTERIAWVEPIEGADNIEMVGVLGWSCIAKKGEFQPNDICVYIEIDSKANETNPAFDFLASKGYKIKTMKLGKFKFRDGPCISQGIALPLDVFIDRDTKLIDALGYTSFSSLRGNLTEGVDVTDALGITYAVAEDNARKNGDSDAKYKSMAARHQKIFKKKWARWLMKRQWGRKIMFLFFGKKKDKPKGFPTQFQGVSKTDQARCENMIWVLNDKTPFIKTQKCDGSSGTYILERKKHNKFEFYVCSRNVRMLKPDQDCFYEKNYYWEAATKYDIENKMKDYLVHNPDIDWVCWQGEICAPSIQKNPHKLKETHFYCFHMTDSKNGRFDIQNAANIWKEYKMEVVPIVDTNYILPDDFNEFKLSADGMYDASVCEGNAKCPREGFVYYKTTDPNFSFKNVSRNYLLSHNG